MSKSQFAFLLGVVVALTVAKTAATFGMFSGW
jgi:hypothetical protein